MAVSTGSDGAALAAALYVIDHLFFALAFAQKTYFQKIADPADIAPTAAVAFTINHIAAVFLPAAQLSLGGVAIFRLRSCRASGRRLACPCPDHPQTSRAWPETIFRRA